MGASSARSSKVQLGRGITSDATSLAQLSSFRLSLTGTTLSLPHLSPIHNSKHNTQSTLACLHTKTHACTLVLPHTIHASAAVLWAQAQGPKKLWHMYSCQL